MVFSQRAPEGTLGLMDTVTHARILAEAGDQTALQGQWRDRTGQGSLKRSTAESQGPACRDPCPDGAPGPQRGPHLFIFLEPLWVRPLPDGLAVASLPRLSQLKLEIIRSFWRHATQETLPLAFSIFLSSQAPPGPPPEVPRSAPPASHPTQPPPRGLGWAPALPLVTHQQHPGSR